MPTLMPWNTVEIGDLDIFAPTLPSLVVYTWYVDDEPESTVTFFWQDEDSGVTLHELLLVAPVTFEEAVSHAQEEAPKRKVEKIHVKHARTAEKAKAAAKPKPAARASAAKAKPAAKAAAAAPRPAAKATAKPKPAAKAAAAPAKKPAAPAKAKAAKPAARKKPA